MLRKGLAILIALALILNGTMLALASEEGQQPMDDPLFVVTEGPQGGHEDGGASQGGGDSQGSSDLEPVDNGGGHTPADPTPAGTAQETGSGGTGSGNSAGTPTGETTETPNGGNTAAPVGETGVPSGLAAGTQETIIPLAQEPKARPDLNAALSFSQDREISLSYRWDEEAQAWCAEALGTSEVGIYVTNTSDVSVGPFSIMATASEVTDEGGLFVLHCQLLYGAHGLTLAPGESAQIAVFSYTAKSGTTKAAEPGQLGVGFEAAYN